MARTLPLTFRSVTGQPREGYQVVLAGTEPLAAVTDAGGVVTIEVPVGATYAVGFGSALEVNGVAYTAGTVLHLTIPDGEGPLALADCLTGTGDASLPTMLQARIDLETALADLQSRVAALEAPAPGGTP